MEIAKELSSIIDLVIIATILVSIVIAFIRGFITEVLSLFVWIGAFVGATFYFEDVAKLLPNIFGGSEAPNLAAAVDPDNLNEVVIASGISFVITFLALLFLFGLINLLISMLIRRLNISWPDRLLGAFFGMLRGMFVVAILALFVTYSPLKESEHWQNAHFSQVATTWAKQLERLVPDNFLEHINTEKIVEKMKGDNEMTQTEQQSERVFEAPELIIPLSPNQ